MTPSDKQMALKHLAAVLQENAGNRLTLALVNGLLVTMQDVWMAQPATDPPQVPAPGTETLKGPT